MESSLEPCLVCLKNNYEDKSLLLFDLSTQEWENVTYLNKLQYVMNADIVIYESTLICSTCLNDLNKAYEFKERAGRALDYWSVKFEDSVNNENKSTVQAEGCGNLETSNLENNDFTDLTEISAYNDDNINISTDVNNTEQREPNESDETGNTGVEDNNKDGFSEYASFACSKCSEAFLTASELIHHSCGSLPSDTDKNKIEEEPSETLKHKKRMKKQKPDTFNCLLCDLTFTKRWKLNKHLKLHNVDKTYSCTFCNRAFKQSYHLREHMTTHTGERNYNCSVCDKSFQRISSQRRHMRTHVALPGEKSKKSPFLCNICGKRFPYSNGAQRHMRIHTGDKRYECTICTRKFNQSTHLRVHLRTHTGEKPYTCHVCGDSFSIKATLHKHMKGHNDVKNDVKIFQNLEPNLSQTESRDDGDESSKAELAINNLPIYDHQGNLVTCNQ